MAGTYRQYMDAAAQADANGDEDDARELYKRAQAAKSTAQETERLATTNQATLDEALPTPLEDRSWIERGGEIARGINRGTAATLEFGADLLDIPYAAAKAGLNPEEGKHPLGAALKAAWGQSGQPIMDMVTGTESELTGPDKWREEQVYDRIPDSLTEKQFEDPLATGAQWFQESLVGGGKKLVKGVISALGSGGGAAVGESYGGPMGELIGGFTGGLTSPTAVRKVGDWISPKVDAPTPDITANDLRGYIQRNVGEENPQDVIDRMAKNKAEGMSGTFADLSENPQMYDLEAAAREGLSPEALAIKAQSDAREAELLTQFRESFGPNSDRINKPAQTSAINTTDALESYAIREEKAKIKVAEEIQEAGEAERIGRRDQKLGDMDVADQKAAETLADPITGPKSEAVADAYETVTNQIRDDKVDPAWASFRKAGAKTSGSAIKKVKDDFITGSMDQVDQNYFNKAFAEDLAEIDKFAERGNVNISELQTIIARMGDSHQAMSRTAGGVTGPMKKLKALQINLTKYMDEVASKAHPDAVKKYNKAKAESVDYYDRVQRDNVRRATRKSEAEVGNALFPAGDAGRTAAGDVNASRDPAVMDATADYIREQGKTMTQASLDNHKQFLDNFDVVDGVQGPRGIKLKEDLEELVSNRSVLSKTAAKRREVESASKAEGKVLTKTLKGTTKDAGNKRKGLVDSVAASNLKKFSTKPKETINNIMGQRDNSGEDLARLAKEVNDPDFMANVADEVARAMKKDLGTVEGTKGLKPSSAADWPALREKLSGAVPEEQLKKADDVIRKTIGSQYRKASKSDRENMIKNSKAKGILVSFASATLASFLPGTHTLMYGGRIRSIISEATENAPAKRAALAKILADPDRMIELANSVTSSDTVTATAQLKSAMANMLKRYAVPIASKDEEAENAQR